MEHRCRECGSERIAVGVRLLAGPAEAGLLGRLHGRLCADCGYLALFVDDPMPVYLEHTRAVEPRAGGAPPGARGSGTAGPANLQCPSCGSVIPAASSACEVCGWSPGPA